MIRRYVLLGVQALVTLAALTSLVQSLDLRALWQLFTELPLWYYVCSLIVVLSGQVLYAWRWWVLLVAAGVDVPFPSVLRQYFVGIFVNNFLPSTVGGDVAKIYYLGRRHGYRTVTMSVVVDRILGIGILATLASLILWLAPLQSLRFAAARLTVTAVAGGATVLLALIAVGTGGSARWLAPFGPFGVKLGVQLQNFRLVMASPIKRPVVLLKAVASVLTYFLGITLIYLWFMELYTPIRPSFITVLAVASTTSVLSNVPISLNGLGVREQLHAWLLAPLGVPAEVAVALSLLLFSHLLVASVVGCVFWWRAPSPSSVSGQGVRAW
jgi:uncharacterized membrane protein YbhN (UPF0104 family)